MPHGEQDTKIGPDAHHLYTGFQYRMILLKSTFFYSDIIKIILSPFKNIKFQPIFWGGRGKFEKIYRES